MGIGWRAAAAAGAVVEAAAAKERTGAGVAIVLLVLSDFKRAAVAHGGCQVLGGDVGSLSLLYVPADSSAIAFVHSG